MLFLKMTENEQKLTLVNYLKNKRQPNIIQHY